MNGQNGIPTLTKDAIEQIYNRTGNLREPIVQLVDVKRIVTSNNGERYRLVISDGSKYIQGMLATQITPMVSSGQIKKHAVIRLSEFVCNQVGNRRICIVIRCSVLAHANGQMGNPSNIQPDNTSSPNRPQPPRQNFNNHHNNSNQQRNQHHQQQQQQRNQNQHNNNNNNFNNPNNNNNNQSNQMNQAPRQNGRILPPNMQREQNNQNNRNNNNNYNNNNNNNNRNNNNNNMSNTNQYQPISTLNPYQNNWRIKVRVTNKETMRVYKNDKTGEGKLFSIDLLDNEGGEIRATMFNEAADKFYPVFNQNSVYLISGGRVTVARKRYTSHIKNDYALTLNANADIIPCNDDNTIQMRHYNFTPFNRINDCNVNSFIDIIGIVTNVQGLSQVQSQKSQQSLDKRVIELVDITKHTIELTLWTDIAHEYDESKLSNNPIIAIKGAKVSDWNGRSLTMSGCIEINPNNINEYNNLNNWWKRNGKNEYNNNINTFSKLTKEGQRSGKTTRMTVGEAQERLGSVVDGELGINNYYWNNVANNGYNNNINNNNDNNNNNNGISVWFETIGTICGISHSAERPPWYKACPRQDSSAKVEEGPDGRYYCTKDGQTYSTYVPKYCLRFNIQGSDGQMWLAAFNDQAEAVLGGVKCKVLEEMLMGGNMDEYEKIFRSACHKKWLFKVRARPDTYQDENRVRYQVQSVSNINWMGENRNLIEQIEMLEKAGANMSGIPQLSGINVGNGGNAMGGMSMNNNNNNMGGMSGGMNNGRNKNYNSNNNNMNGRNMGGMNNMNGMNGRNNNNNGNNGMNMGGMSGGGGNMNGMNGMDDDMADFGGFFN